MKLLRFVDFLKFDINFTNKLFSHSSFDKFDSCLPAISMPKINFVPIQELPLVEVGDCYFVKTMSSLKHRSYA